MGLAYSYYYHPALLIKQFWLDYPQDAPRHLHPALLALVRAIAGFRRAGREEDAEAWRDWVQVVFEKEDWEKAFAMEFELPEFESEVEDVRHAELWLKLAGKELARKRVVWSKGERREGRDRGAYELFLDEIREYEERKHRDVRDVLPGSEELDVVRSVVWFGRDLGRRS